MQDHFHFNFVCVFRVYVLSILLLHNENHFISIYHSIWLNEFHDIFVKKSSNHCIDRVIKTKLSFKIVVNINSEIINNEWTSFLKPTDFSDVSQSFWLLEKQTVKYSRAQKIYMLNDCFCAKMNSRRHFHWRLYCLTSSINIISHSCSFSIADSLVLLLHRRFHWQIWMKKFKFNVDKKMQRKRKTYYGFGLVYHIK